MKIGIFGDSFADPGYFLNSIDKRPIGPSWVEILSKKYQVSTFAEGGSSLHFSYKKIIDTSDNFDYIVLCVTDYWRMSLTSEFLNPIKTNIEKPVHVSGINGVNYLKIKAENSKNISVPEKNNILSIAESIKNYFLYWRQDSEVQLFHKLMIADLERRYKNIILIPSFNNSYGDELMHDTVGLFEVSNNELKSKGFFEKFPKAFSETPPLKQFDNRMLTDYRRCHFSYENNLILANIVSDCIKNEFTGRLKINKNLFVIPEKPLEFYLGLTNGYDTIGYPLAQ